MKYVDLPPNFTHGENPGRARLSAGAEYHPQRTEPPLDSKLPFTPADFCIGESGVWFFSLMWEHGQDAPPVEFLDDRNILTKAASERRSPEP